MQPNEIIEVLIRPSSQELPRRAGRPMLKYIQAPPPPGPLKAGPEEQVAITAIAFARGRPRL
ncbi:hypothetical protein [Streptomyces hawaiiensis]|jgi:hypothetical protein|uniref:Uncharacterized protein n=1 Tax=Streptomyces hawaiiensis TaxID=67305 RepID=A0A6G5R754_9ACTN|nr:hypothetical protein [Streptomyces hawaiiensis]QCD53659.1 hypothetical protein CEB94_01160 [Streptomyces hawaiiensis]